MYDLLKTSATPSFLSFIFNLQSQILYKIQKLFALTINFRE